MGSAVKNTEQATICPNISQYCLFFSGVAVLQMIKNSVRKCGCERRIARDSAF